MNNGVYALPGFMAPAAKNWKSQLLTNEDGSVKLCVYVGKPGTKVYYSLGIPGWKWGFIKDAQYFIDKGYPEEVIKEVSKFADYLEEEVTAIPEGTVIPDIIINGWPVPITESPIEGKVYWILNIPKFILPAGDTEVQISANGKLLKYTITRPDFSIHYNDPGYTIPAGTPGGGSSTGGLTSEERALLSGAAQRDADNTFTAGNIFTGSVDMSTAQVTPPSGWNVDGAELTAAAIQAIVPIKWSAYTTAPTIDSNAGNIAIGEKASARRTSVAIGYDAGAYNRAVAIGDGTEAGQISVSIGSGAKGGHNYGIAIGSGAYYNGNNAIALGADAGDSSTVAERSVTIGSGAKSKNSLAITLGSQFTETVNGQNVKNYCQTQGTGSITIGAGANTLNTTASDGTVTESSNSVTIGCKAENNAADSVVIGAQASASGTGGVAIGAAVANVTSGVAVGRGAKTLSGVAIGNNANDYYGTGVAIGRSSMARALGATAVGSRTDAGTWAVTIGEGAKAPERGVAIGFEAKASSSWQNGYCVAIGYKAVAMDQGVVALRSVALGATNAKTPNTQLYFSGANTPLANEYEDGEAMLGYVTTDGDGNILAAGTQKLSVLCPNNSTFQPATLSLDDDMPTPKVFHPSDLDMPVEEPSEPEEYTPLPVYPIVEPEIEDINLINAE